MLFIKFYARIRYDSSLGENVYFSREKSIHSKGWPSHFWQTENHPLKGVPFLVCTRRYEKFARKIQIRETCNDDRPFTIQKKTQQIKIDFFI